MARFGKEKPDPKKKHTPSPEEMRNSPALRKIYEAVDGTLAKYLPDASRFGKVADLFAASDEERDAFIDQVLDLYQAQEGRPFVAAPQSRAVDVGTAHQAVLLTIERLGRTKKYCTATAQEEDAYHKAAEQNKVSPERREYEAALHRVYSYMRQFLIKGKPIIDQMNEYIDGVQLQNAPRSLYDGLQAGSEQELRSKLKDEFVLRLITDGYFSKS